MAHSEFKIGRRKFLAGVAGSLVGKSVGLSQLTKRRLSHPARLTFCIPANWFPDRTLRYDYSDSSDFIVSQNLNILHDHVSSVDHAARLVASSWLYPDIDSVARYAWRGINARLISASPDLDSPYSIVFPHPVGSESDGTFYCAITTTRRCFDSVISTISFDVNLITPELYADSAIDFMEGRSLFRDSIAWNDLRKRALSTITPRSTHRYYWEAYPAISMILDTIRSLGGDIHNQLIISRSNNRSVLSLGAPLSSGFIIDDEIGYLRVPGFSGSSPASVFFTERLSDQINQMSRHGVSRWIVDLRNNPGGDMYPALWGLLHVMNHGKLLSIHPPSGDAIYLSKDQRGGLSLQEVSLPPPVPIPPEDTASLDVPVPLAILVGSETASAGEAIMLALRSSSASLTFGSPTAGAMTGPSGLSLVDGAELTISTWRIGDANGRTYMHPYTPDVLRPSDSESTASADDSIVREATVWLQSQEHSPHPR